MKKIQRFLDNVDTILASCPRCGGDGMCKNADAAFAPTGDDVFFDYEDCPVCSDIREAVHIARVVADDGD